MEQIYTFLDLKNNIPTEEQYLYAKEQINNWLESTIGFYPPKFYTIKLDFRKSVGLFGSRIRATPYTITGNAYGFEIEIRLTPNKTKGRKKIVIESWSLEINCSSTSVNFTPDEMLYLMPIFKLWKEKQITNFYLDHLGGKFSMKKRQSRNYKDVFSFSPEHFIWATALDCYGDVWLNEHIELTPDLQTILNRTGANYCYEHRATDSHQFTMINRELQKSEEKLVGRCPFTLKRVADYDYNLGEDATTKPANIMLRYQGNYISNQNICSGCTNEFSCMSSNFKNLLPYSVSLDYIG